MKNRINKAFTLVELITVMAIAAILLSIIAVPMIQSFNLTRAAQGFAAAQDRARILMEKIIRDVSNSAGVRDNSGLKGALVLHVPGQNGAIEPVLMQHAKIDLYLPAQGEENINGGGGNYINPDTGKVDPTIHDNKGQVVLPVAPGATLRRYFIGLRRPVVGDAPQTYINPFDGVLMARTSQQDNLYVLYEADVQPYVFQGGNWVVNQRYFAPDPANPNAPLYDDPFFYTFRGTAGPNGEPVEINWATRALTAAGNIKLARVKQWMRVARIVTEINRYDMIQPVFDRKTGLEIYDGNVPRISSLINFAPTRILSEPAKAMTAVRSGDETFNSSKVGPDVFRTEFGAWASTIVRVWPSTYPGAFSLNQQSSQLFNGWIPNTPYGIIRQTAPSEAPGPPRTVQFMYDPNVGTDDMGTLGALPMFDISEYQNAIGNKLSYPFSRGLNSAISLGFNPNLNKNLFVPVIPDTRQGELVSSFAITEVGNPGGPPPPVGSDNRPITLGGAALSPNNDSTLIAGPPLTRWQNAAYSPSSVTSTINQRFNVLWNDWPVLAPALDRAQYVKRFIDLRFAGTRDNTPSPLQPLLGWPRCFIVPGSEIVIGPDQTPGMNYGHPVRYTRVTQRPVGPNQYFINYVNQKEPDWSDPSLGLTVPANVFDPASYQTTSFLQAVLQPQFRAGYVELNSRYGEPIPYGYDADNSGTIDPNEQVPISVNYRFSFSEPSDTVAVDYDSRQLIKIVMTIRNYAQTTLPNPQTVTLEGSASVRNFFR